MSAFIYSTPALVQDFSEDPALQQQMYQTWDSAIDAYTQAAIVSNPWTATNQAPCNWYVNPKQVAITPANPVEAIFWTAFPNRIKLYFSAAEKSPYNFTDEQVYQLADFANLEDQLPDPNGIAYPIPSQRCPNLDWSEEKSKWRKYDPSGPRGWLDEYCEWAVTRNADGKITKISFTCENPEYWFCLWQVSPDKVLQLYQQLVHPSVQLCDLQLHDSQNQPVLDPVTGAPAYNPLNKWNSGTVATDSFGGAVHLTSPPNTIGAEIMLASQASLLRNLPAAQYNMQRLICSGKFGRPYRNSDPHIGLQANQLVKNLNVKITLNNPVGLYLQRPDFSNYKTPDGSDAALFYKIIRGRTAQQAGTTYDQILHAEFSVPPEYGYTVSDILIGHAVPGSSQVPVPINYAGQVADTFHVCLAGAAIPPAANEPAQTPLPPVGDVSCPSNGQVNMLLANPVLQAMLAVNQNSPFVQLPVKLKAGQSISNLALQTTYLDDNFEDVEISFWNEQGQVESALEVSVSAITNPDGSPATAPNSDQTYNYILTLRAGAKCKPGLKGVTVRNPKAGMPVPLPGVVQILA